MMYDIYLRRRGAILHRQSFHTDGDHTAMAIAGAVFNSSDALWDSYELWAGIRLLGGSIPEKLEELGGHVEETAVTIEESIQRLDAFAEDRALTARIKAIRIRHPRPTSIS